MPAPPSIVSLMTPAGSVVAVTPSLPPSALTTSESLAPSELVMFTWAGSPTTETEVPAPKTSMMSLPLVPLTMTVSAAASPAVPPIAPARLTLISTTSVPDRSLTVIVSAPPRALRSIALDVVEVHDDVADVAGEAHALAVGRGVEDLVDGAAVEQHRVGAVLALDGVAAVARIPLEDVVAGAQEGDVVALLAVDEVVAVAAEQQVGAVAAEDRVVARAAVDGDLDQGGQVAGGGEAVVAAVGVEDEASREVPMSIENGAGLRRSKRTRVPLAVAVNCLGAVAAVDLDGVDAGAALVEVGVVAGVPDHAVVAATRRRPGRRRRRRSGCRSRCRRTGSRSRPCRAACRCRPGRRACRRPSRR